MVGGEGGFGLLRGKHGIPDRGCSLTIEPQSIQGTARRLRNSHTHPPCTAPAHRFRVGRQPKWQTVKVIGEGDLTHYEHHNI